jgi:hypothetical protein
MKKKDSKVHVELSDDVRYEVKGEGMVTFHLESGGSLNAHHVLYVPGVKKKLLSISTMEDIVFFITFQKWEVLIHP